MLFLGLTVVLALIFTVFQGAEYLDAPFTISDTMYGSSFYMATGFHGFHVIVGTAMLVFTLTRLQFGQLSAHHHVGFEAAA